MQTQTKNRNKKGYFLALLILAGGVFFAQVSLARAADEATARETVQVSPVRLDWNLADGDQRDTVIKLSNFTDKPYTVKVQLEDFSIKDDSSAAEYFVPDDNHPLKDYDTINWFRTPEMDFVMGPNERRDVPFTVKVPDNAPTGGYYGVIFFQYEEQNDGSTVADAGAKMQVHTRTGVLVTMAVKGSEPVMEKGSLDEFSVNKKLFWQGPAMFNANVSNDGNIHYKMIGNINIERAGKPVTQLSIDSRLYYPNKVRSFENQWDFGMFAFGQYTATLKMVSEDGLVILNGKTTFWVIPTKVIIISLAFLLFLYIIFKTGNIMGHKKGLRKNSRLQ